MNRAQLAMAYQACEVADLAAAVVVASDPAEALAQAARVLAAAHRLVAAANFLATDLATADLAAVDLAAADLQTADLAEADLVAGAGRLADHAKPTDPLQLFAYEHPEEAAADITEWLRCRGHACRGQDCPEGAAAPAPD